MKSEHQHVMKSRSNERQKNSKFCYIKFCKSIYSKQAQGHQRQITYGDIFGSILKISNPLKSSKKSKSDRKNSKIELMITERPS